MTYPSAPRARETGLGAAHALFLSTPAPQNSQDLTTFILKAHAIFVTVTNTKRSHSIPIFYSTLV